MTTVAAALAACGSGATAPLSFAEQMEANKDTPSQTELASRVSVPASGGTTPADSAPASGPTNTATADDAIAATTSPEALPLPQPEPEPSESALFENSDETSVPTSAADREAFVVEDAAAQIMAEYEPVPGGSDAQTPTEIREELGITLENLIPDEVRNAGLTAAELANGSTIITTTDPVTSERDTQQVHDTGPQEVRWLDPAADAEAEIWLLENTLFGSRDMARELTQDELSCVAARIEAAGLDGEARQVTGIDFQDVSPAVRQAVAPAVLECLSDPTMARLFDAVDDGFLDGNCMIERGTTLGLHDHQLAVEQVLFGEFIEVETADREVFNSLADCGFTYAATLSILMDDYGLQSYEALCVFMSSAQRELFHYDQQFGLLALDIEAEYEALRICVDTETADRLLADLQSLADGSASLGD